MAAALAVSKNNSAAQNSSLALFNKFSPLVYSKAITGPAGFLHSLMARPSSALPIFSTNQSRPNSSLDWSDDQKPTFNKK